MISREKSTEWLRVKEAEALANMRLQERCAEENRKAILRAADDAQMPFSRHERQTKRGILGSSSALVFLW